MNATVYKFTKDTRSTARPTTGGTSITGIVFKENTSRENPVLKITAAALSDDYDWNYIHILGSYYYINDIVFVNNDIFELHCSIDVLATYKTEIEASTQYIVRSTNSNFVNGYINDTAYPLTNYISTDHRYWTGSSGWFSSSAGMAVIGVLGPNGGDTTTYYEMTTAALEAFLTTLYGVDVSQQLNIGSIEVGLLKTLYDPIKYITSCVLLPYSGTITANTTTIKLGYLNLSIPSNIPIRKIMPNEGREFTCSIEYGFHPQASTRGAYINNSPYTERMLTVLPFGTFHLDGGKLNDYDNKIRLKIKMMKNDGNAILECYTVPDSGSGFHNTLFWSNAQLGLQVPLYQSDSIFKQAYSLLSSQTSMVGSVLSGNYTSVPGIATQWIGDVNKVHAPDVHMVGGSSGSFISLTEYRPSLDTTYYSVTPIDDNLGRMVCKNLQLSTVPGFHICQNSRIEIPGPATDAEAIKNIMNTGIIIP